MFIFDDEDDGFEKEYIVDYCNDRWPALKGADEWVSKVRELNPQSNNFGGKKSLDNLLPGALGKRK